MNVKATVYETLNFKLVWKIQLMFCTLLFLPLKAYYIMSLSMINGIAFWIWVQQAITDKVTSSDVLHRLRHLLSFHKQAAGCKSQPIIFSVTKLLYSCTVLKKQKRDYLKTMVYIGSRAYSKSTCPCGCVRGIWTRWWPTYVSCIGCGVLRVKSAY